MHGLCNTCCGRGPPPPPWRRWEDGLGSALRPPSVSLVLPAICLGTGDGSDVAAALPPGSACLRGPLVPPFWVASGNDWVQRRGGRWKPLLVSQSALSGREKGEATCACGCACVRVRSGSPSLQVSAEDVPPPCLSRTESNRLRCPDLEKLGGTWGAQTRTHHVSLPV